MHSGLGPHIQDALKNQGRDLRLLIIKTSSLGDLCHTLPAIAGLRSALPKAHLTWLVNEEYKAFLEGFAPVDEVITFDRQGFRERIPSALRKLGQLVQGLQARRFHIALDFQGLLRSAAFSLASRALVRIGPAEAREGTLFYTHRQRSPRFMEHPTHRALRLLSALGISGFSSSGFKSEILPEREARVAERFAENRLKDPVILLPGARWPSKSWPEASWQELVSLLPDQRLLILGGPAERALGERLSRESHVLSWAGQTRLEELPDILKRGRFVVGGDSGPLHLAVILGRPVLGLYGSTVWRRTYPLGAGNRILKRRGLECLECRRRVCPIPGHPCMTDLSPKIVAETLREALKSPIHLTKQ